MDPLLARQLRRLGLDAEGAPTEDQWRKFLTTLDDHYRKTEEDRTMLVRSMEVSTDEMDELRRKAESQRDTFRGVIGAFQSVIETILGVLEREGSGSVKVGPYLRMELLRGADLRGILTRGKRRPEVTSEPGVPPTRGATIPLDAGRGGRPRVPDERDVRRPRRRARQLAVRPRPQAGRLPRP